jgi:hypothetical protein
MSLTTWATRHGVSAQALAELYALMGVSDERDNTHTDMSEAGVQSRIRIEAAEAGCHLWRNNVGVLPTDTGRPLRYGLANDSKQMNQRIKSADLIGIRPVLITQAHVGTVIGQFLSREVKKGGWKYTGSDREVAQFAWAKLITRYGGDAAFAASEGSI